MGVINVMTSAWRRMMKKVLLVVLAILVLSVFALSACSSGEPAAEPNGDAAVETVVVDGDASGAGAGDGADAAEVTAAP